MDTTFDPDTAVTLVTDHRHGHRHREDTDARASTDPPADTSAHENTGVTGLTGVSDLHRTKVPADDPRLKIERPKSRTLRRGPAIAAALALGGIVLVALIVAVSPSTPAADDDAKNGGGDSETSNANSVTLPDMLRDNPSTDTPLGGRPTSTSRIPADASMTAAEGTSPGPSAAAQRAETFKQARHEEFLRARGGGIFAAVDDAPGAEPPLPREGAAGPKEGSSSEIAKDTLPRSQPPSDPSRAATDANMQDRKNDFLARAGVSSTEYLDKGVTTPRSPYEIKAGTVIPTVLITGINSDLPGQVVGQVRENVYDTVSGNYLLIPQGSRVLAAYDSMVAWGQERVLVCWNRVIRPDGSSISLDCMPGVDLAGYAGFSDEVDNHWWRIISGAAFSSLLAATAQRSQGDVTTYQPSFPQVWASGAAGQINQAGQQVTAKNLQIQPTITVRPGWSVNVLVSKDLILPPYSP